MAQAQSIAHDLIEEINRLSLSGASVSEFTARSLYQRADKLAAADPAAALSAKGMIACVVGDHDAMRRFHQGAIAASGGLPLYYLTYAQALLYAEFYAEALPLALKAHELDPGNPEYLEEAISQHMVAGQFSKMLELIDEWSQLNPSGVHEQKQLALTVTARMRELNLSDDEVTQIVDEVSSFVRGKAVKSRQWSIAPRTGDEVQLPLLFSLIVQASPDEVAELNFELAEAIAPRIPDDLSQVMLFRCKPAESGAARR